MFLGTSVEGTMRFRKSFRNRKEIDEIGICRAVSQLPRLELKFLAIVVLAITVLYYASDEYSLRPEWTPSKFFRRTFSFNPLTILNFLLSIATLDLPSPGQPAVTRAWRCFCASFAARRPH